jgi:hypothetical protein
MIGVVGGPTLPANGGQDARRYETLSGTLATGSRGHLARGIRVLQRAQSPRLRNV